MIPFKAFSQRHGECCRTEGKMEALVLARGAAESHPAAGRLRRGGGMDEGSGTWVQRARRGTFTAGALVSKRRRSYMIVYEVDQRTINASGLWGMVIAFAAAGKAACLFTSLPHQLLVRGA